MNQPGTSQGREGAAGHSVRRPFARREPIGFRIRMSSGQLISTRYVEPNCDDADGTPAVFPTRRAASAFIRRRKGECKQQRILCAFTTYKYRLEPVYGRH